MDNNTYAAGLDPNSTVDEQTLIFDLSLPDDQIIKSCINNLQDDIGHWEQAPWLLTRTDKENTAYLMGDQDDAKVVNPQTQTPYVDNRLFAGVRAILAYATGQTAKPELTPSKPDDKYKHMAKQMEMGLYQHAMDHEVNVEFQLATKNLVTRKRGCIMLRYDEYAGPFGDIITENVDPSDIVISKYANFRGNPERIHRKQKATIDQLVAKFPDKKDLIYNHFGLKRGVYSQVSRVVTYWECWFTYYDAEGEQEGLCWYLPNSEIVLGKMQNPNWIYKGSKKQQKITNMTTCPIKPFVWFNYWNTGRSYIDETCLFDQAIPLQNTLNKRARQIIENADYANPRLLVNGALWDESDAKKFVNKNAKTIGVLNKMDSQDNMNNAAMVIQPSQLPSYVMEDKNDARTEIDTMLGTPTQFRGQQAQSKNPTLGQDLLVKNQAAALQDDLVVSINRAWQTYYTYLIQMMNTYLDDDYWVMVKGSDGDYAHIVMGYDNIDTSVRISVGVDSTLPLDKAAQRATAIQLAQMNRIDDLSLYEALGLPEPEKLAERKLRWEIDRYTYMESIEQKLMSQEAETDLTLLIANKVPEERDDYDEDYLNHFNLFLTTNRFNLLPVPAKQRITAWLQAVADRAAKTEAMRDSMFNPAGILDKPPLPPMPKRDIRIMGQLSPQDSQQMAGLPPQQAVGGPAQQPTPQSAPGGSPPAPVGVASQPRLQNPTQFGH